MIRTSTSPITISVGSGEKRDIMNELNERHKQFLALQSEKFVARNGDAIKWFSRKINGLLDSQKCRAAYVRLYAETGRMDDTPNECKTGEVIDAPSEKTFNYDWDYVRKTLETLHPGVQMYSGSMYADGPSFEIQPQAFKFSKEELDSARQNWLKTDEIAQTNAVVELIPKLNNLADGLNPKVCADAHIKWYIEHGYFTEVLADCLTSYVESHHKTLPVKRLRESWKKEGFGVQEYQGSFRAYMTQNEAFKHI